MRPASDYKNYIAADDGTDLKYRVPVFPYTGDAFITCTKGGKTVTYAYPVQSKNNENDLYPIGKYKAMEVTDDEATKLVTGSDLGWTEKGNNLIVNSSVTGMTALKAIIDINGIDEDELNAHNGKVLYTSVQWSPVTTSSGSAAVYPDYYAVEGQTVTVIAQLTDKNNNKATAGNQTIDFTYGEGASKQSIHAGKTITLANGKKIYVQSNTFNTDSNGQARLERV